jgi:hypothetical protein
MAEFQNPRELTVAVKSENTLALFLGAITGALKAEQLDREYGQYVSNMDKIIDLAESCYASIDVHNPSRRYFSEIIGLQKPFLKTIAQVPVSNHIAVLERLASFYNAAKKYSDISDIPYLDPTEPKIQESFPPLLEAIETQISYVNNLTILKGPLIDLDKSEGLAIADRIKLRAGVAAIGAIWGATLGVSYRLPQVELVFPNGTASTFSVAGTFIGWYASNLIALYIVTGLASFFRKDWAVCNRFVINLFMLLALISIVMIPNSVSDMWFSVLGLPAIIVAILTGIDVSKYS